MRVYKKRMLDPIRVVARVNCVNSHKHLLQKSGNGRHKAVFKDSLCYSVPNQVVWHLFSWEMRMRSKFGTDSWLVTITNWNFSSQNTVYTTNFNES